MESFVFEADDLAEVEQFLCAQYTSAQLEAPKSKPARTRVHRRWLGPISMDELELSFDMAYESDPMGKICVISVHDGTIREHESTGSTTVYGPGDVGALGFPDRPIIGDLHQIRDDVVLLDELLLDRVAQVPPGRGEPGPVRLTGHQAVSPAAGRHLAGTIECLRGYLSVDSVITRSELIASTAVQFLAASVLSTFPNNALFDPTIEDRHDSRPVLVRRAVAFIDDNAHRDIALADIAAAVDITPRAVQYGFRTHLDCTPMEYVRRVRLHHAHCDLVAADRGETTVTAIAAKWGFAHTGHFATRYRETYGQSPHETLQSGF